MLTLERILKIMDQEANSLGLGPMTVTPRVVISKDAFYCAQVDLIATRSKDPNTQCGAVIVAEDGCPLGQGYNGTPKCFDDNSINWSRETKYLYVVHSEENAINHSPRERLKGATLYVNNRPCSGCMLRIADAGITRVVFIDRPISDPLSSLNDPKKWEQSKQIAKLANIRLEKFENGSCVPEP